MKVLFLDDMPHRHESFDEHFGDGSNDITHVETVEESINKLESCVYDAIFLDHDLGGTYYAPSDDKSGYAVAEWIANNVKHKPIIIIHSMNPAGSIRMYNVMKERGFNPILTPFTCLMGNY